MCGYVYVYTYVYIYDLHLYYTINSAWIIDQNVKLKPIKLPEENCFDFGVGEFFLNMMPKHNL